MFNYEFHFPSIHARRLCSFGIPLARILRGQRIPLAARGELTTGYVSVRLSFLFTTAGIGTPGRSFVDGFVRLSANWRRCSNLSPQRFHFTSRDHVSPALSARECSSFLSLPPSSSSSFTDEVAIKNIVVRSWSKKNAYRLLPPRSCYQVSSISQ